MPAPSSEPSLFFVRPQYVPRRFVHENVRIDQKVPAVASLHSHSGAFSPSDPSNAQRRQTTTRGVDLLWVLSAKADGVEKQISGRSRASATIENVPPVPEEAVAVAC